MKVFQSAILRALVAVVVGILLIVYRKSMLEWIVFLAGSLFFLSGCLSCLVYYLGRRRVERAAQVIDQKGNIMKVPKPLLPIAGVGSVLLGVILMLMTGSFLRGVAYVLAAILVLGSINQFVTLGSARRFARVPLIYWLLPAVTLGIGAIILLKPIDAMASPLLIIGWCLVFYGVVELLNSLKVYQLQRQWRKAEDAQVVVGEQVDNGFDTLNDKLEVK